MAAREFREALQIAAPMPLVRGSAPVAARALARQTRIAPQTHPWHPIARFAFADVRRIAVGLIPVRAP